MRQKLKLIDIKQEPRIPELLVTLNLGRKVDNKIYLTVTGTDSKGLENQSDILFIDGNTGTINLIQFVNTHLGFALDSFGQVIVNKTIAESET